MADEDVPLEKKPSALGPQKKPFPVMKRSRKSLGEKVESLDVDVTPMMNFFMIMLPFLMSMTVFTQIAIMEFSLPPAVSSEVAQTLDSSATKELDISIIVTKEGFRIVGTGKKLDIIPLTMGQYQFNELRMLLQAIKFQYPSQKAVVLVLDSEVLYDDIIKFMDVCRESQFPDIGLSGGIS